MDMMLKIANRTVISFSVFIGAVSVIGFLLGDLVSQTHDFSTLFLIPNAIPYTTVFQAGIACFVLSILNIGLEECKRYRTLLFLWQWVIQMILSALLVLAFIVMFDWFSITNASALISFIISFMVSMGIALSLTLYKTKKQNKEYQNLFEEYKKRHEKGE